MSDYVSSHTGVQLDAGVTTALRLTATTTHNIDTMDSAITALQLTDTSQDAAVAALQTTATINNAAIAGLVVATGTITTTLSSHTSNTDLHQPRVSIIVARDGTGDYNCDGSNDNVQIQAAIDYVGGLGGGLITVKPGTYVTDHVDIDSNNIYILFEKGAIIQKDTSIDSYMFTIDGDDITVDGGKFDANYAQDGTPTQTQGAATIIRVASGSNRIHVINGYFQNFGDSAFRTGEQGDTLMSYDIYFSNNFVDKCSFGYKISVCMAGVTRGFILNNIIKEADDGCGTTSYLTLATKDILISGNTLNNCSLEVWGSSELGATLYTENVVVSNNTFTRNTYETTNGMGGRVYLNRNIRNITVSNNNFYWDTTSDTAASPINIMAGVHYNETVENLNIVGNTVYATDTTNKMNDFVRITCYYDNSLIQDINIENNEFKGYLNYTAAINFVGNASATNNVKRVRIKNNKFSFTNTAKCLKLYTTSGTGHTIYTDIEVSDNTFIKTDGNITQAVEFGTETTDYASVITNFILKDNYFKPLLAGFLEQASTTTVATGVLIDNNIYVDSSGNIKKQNQALDTPFSISSLNGHWKLNGDAQDSSSYALHGTATNVVYSTGYFGGTQSASFASASSSRIEVTDNALLRADGSAGESFTAAAWIYHTTDTSDIIVSKRKSDTTRGWALAVTNANILTLYSRIEGSSGVTVAQPTANAPRIEVNKWYHVGCVVNEDTNLHKLYINGVLVHSETPANIGGNINSYADNLRIGAYMSNTVSLFSGKIQEVMFFKRALADSEFKVLYETTSPIPKVNDTAIAALQTTATSQAATIAILSAASSGGTSRSVTKTISRVNGEADYYCDGTNDNVEIAAAVNSISSTGGTILIRRGSYSMGDKVRVYSNTNIIGEGMATVISVATSATAGGFYTLAGDVGCSFENFYITCVATSNTSIFEPLTTTGSYHKVKNVTIYDCSRNGISNWQGHHNIFENCVISRCAVRTTGDNIILYGYDNIVSKCVCYDNVEVGGFGNGIGVYSSIGATYNNVVGDCICYNNTSHGFNIEGGNETTISNCMAFDNDRSGFSMISSARNPQFVGCNSFNNGEYGFHLSGGENYLVSGCTAASNTDRGLNIGGSSTVNNAVISGCIFNNNATGIQTFSTSSNIVIEGCSFNSNTTGVLLSTGNKITIANCNFKNHTGTGISVTADCDYITISGCTIDSSGIAGTNNGISFNGNDYSKIIGNTVMNSYGHGIYLTGCNYCNINDNVSINNSRATTTVYSGIRLSGTSSNFNIQGNICSDNQATKTQAYGLRCDGTQNYHLITGNNFVGNGLSSMSGSFGVSSDISHNME